MSKTSKVALLTILLIIVLGSMYFLYTYDNNSTIKSESSHEFSSSNVGYVEISGEREKSNKKVLVNDKYVAKPEKDAEIIIFAKDGSIYEVKSGTVLVDDSVIEKNSEGFTIQRLDEPEKSISS